MNSKPAHGIEIDTVDEQAVAVYLQQHPDFFERHTPLLTRLRLQHPRNASTVSLIERQVEVLREKHAALEQKLAEFVRVARANDALAEKIQRFTQRLLRTGTAAAALAQVEASLREDFDTYNGILILQRPIAAGNAERFVRVVAPDDPVFRTFESLLAGGKPRCGQVRDIQRDFLFGNDASEIASIALIPLTGLMPPGLLALGSSDRDRFHPGMSTDFLSRMGELIAAAISRP